MALFGKRKPKFKSVFAHSKQFPMAAVLEACYNKTNLLATTKLTEDSYALPGIDLGEHGYKKAASPVIKTKEKHKDDSTKTISKPVQSFEMTESAEPQVAPPLSKRGKKTQEKTVEKSVIKADVDVKSSAKSAKKKEKISPQVEEKAIEQTPSSVLMTVLPQKLKQSQIPKVMARLVDAEPTPQEATADPSARIGVSILQLFTVKTEQVPLLNPESLFFDLQLLDPVLSDLALISDVPLESSSSTVDSTIENAEDYTQLGDDGFLDERLLPEQEDETSIDVDDAEMPLMLYEAEREDQSLLDNVISFPHAPRPVDLPIADTLNIVSISDEMTPAAVETQGLVLDEVLEAALDLNLLEDDAQLLSDRTPLVTAEEADNAVVERPSLMGFDESRLQASGARLLRIVHKLESHWLLLAQRPEAMILLADNGEGMALLKTFAGTQWSPEATLESQLTRLPRKTLCSIRIGDWQGIVCDDQRGVRLEAEVKVLEA